MTPLPPRYRVTTRAGTLVAVVYADSVDDAIQRARETACCRDKDEPLMAKRVGR